MDKQLEKLLVIVAKDPLPGKVKTRLFPKFSPVIAAELYRCFLHDRIQEVSTLSGVDRAIAYTPEDARETFTTLALDGFELFAQRGKHLGERLNNPKYATSVGILYHATHLLNEKNDKIGTIKMKDPFTNFFKKLIANFKDYL